MQYFIPTTIFIATVIGFLFGSIWYSPYLFMKAWLIGEGVTQEELPKRSKLYLVQINLYAFIAHGVIASVIALMFDLISPTSLKVAVSLGALFAFGFIIATHYVDMLYTPLGTHWNRKSQIKFLVNSGYYLSVTCIISTALFLVGTR